jgi:hypothetical protein
LLVAVLYVLLVMHTLGRPAAALLPRHVLIDRLVQDREDWARLESALSLRLYSRKRLFLSHLYLQTNILPRQARDTRIGKTQKKDSFLKLSEVCPEPVSVK